MAGQGQGLSIKGSIKLFLWFIVLKMLLAIPFFILAEVLGVLTGIDLDQYITIFGDALITLYLIRQIVRKRGFKIELTKFPGRAIYLPVILLVVGFRLVFDNTIFLSLLYWEMPRWLTEHFIEMLPHPGLIVFSTLFVAPLFEEVLNRGIFFKQLAKNYSQSTALLVSSLFFALLHLNLPQGINSFMLGLLFGLIYSRTDSLMLAIFAHFVNNVYALLGLYNFSLLPASQGAFNFFATVIGVIFLILGFFFFRRLTAKSGLGHEISK